MSTSLPAQRSNEDKCRHIRSNIRYDLEFWPFFLGARREQFKQNLKSLALKQVKNLDWFPHFWKEHQELLKTIHGAIREGVTAIAPTQPFWLQLFNLFEGDRNAAKEIMGYCVPSKISREHTPEDPLAEFGTPEKIAELRRDIRRFDVENRAGNSALQ